MITTHLVDRLRATLLQARESVFLRHFDSVEAEDKFGTVVTVADREAGALINRTLAALTPGVPVLNEETSPITDPAFIEAVFSARHVWAVDPIDGTTNYSMGNPNFCSAVALCQCCEQEIRPIWGMMFDPTRNGFVYQDADGAPVYELVGSYQKKLVLDRMKISALLKGGIIAVKPDVVEKAVRWRFHEARRNQFIESQVMNGMLAAAGKLSAAAVGGHLWDFAAPFAVASALGLGPWRLDGTRLAEIPRSEFILDGDDPDDYWRLRGKAHAVIAHPALRDRFFSDGV
ncbi:MAG: hypothetical protein JJT96_15770 [Opitutales bacterium]|nr:hypothetical protein [Opitutales bacterium]